MIMFELDDLAWIQRLLIVKQRLFRLLSSIKFRSSTAFVLSFELAFVSRHGSPHGSSFQC